MSLGLDFGGSPRRCRSQPISVGIWITGLLPRTYTFMSMPSSTQARPVELLHPPGPYTTVSMLLLVGVYHLLLWLVLCFM